MIEKLADELAAVVAECLEIGHKLHQAVKGIKTIRPIGKVTVAYHKKEDLWLICCGVMEETGTGGLKRQFLEVKINRERAESILREVEFAPLRQSLRREWGIPITAGDTECELILTEEQMVEVLKNLLIKKEGQE